MPEYMRGNGFRDPGFVSHLLDDPLDGADGHASAVMLGKVVLNQSSYAIG